MGKPYRHRVIVDGKVTLVPGDPPAPPAPPLDIAAEITVDEAPPELIERPRRRLRRKKVVE